MNKDNPIELSSSSSQESLGESLEKHRQSSEIDWKKSTTTARSEIEISGSKEEAAGTSSVARDVRRLKSATLDRMGKMLRIHSKSSGEKSDGTSRTEGAEDAARKQKFNSLTRMLRLVDKEDSSKSLEQDRGLSLSRILRRKAPIEGDNPSDKPEDHMPGIFSRLLGQFRGRIFKSDSTSKGETSKVTEQSNLPPKSPSDSTLSELNLETSSPIMNIRYEA